MVEEEEEEEDRQDEGKENISTRLLQHRKRSAMVATRSAMGKPLRQRVVKAGMGRPVAHHVVGKPLRERDVGQEERTRICAWQRRPPSARRRVPRQEPGQARTGHDGGSDEEEPEVVRPARPEHDTGAPSKAEGEWRMLRHMPYPAHVAHGASPGEETARITEARGGRGRSAGSGNGLLRYHRSQRG